MSLIHSCLTLESTGAVISLLTAITTEYKLAGVIALSGFLGLSGKIESMQTEHARKLPIFWGHGKSDDVVRCACPPFVAFAACAHLLDTKVHVGRSERRQAQVAQV